MPGATEGHGHFILSATLYALELVKITQNLETLLDFVKDNISKNPTSSLYLTFGWDNYSFNKIKNTINIRKELDNIFKDKPLVVIDNTGHNLFMNSKTIEIAGINENTAIDEGYFSKDSNGNLLGLASEVAMNYILANVVKPANFISSNDFEKAIEATQAMLHSNGYTYYLDGNTSYFGNPHILELMNTIKIMD